MISLCSADSPERRAVAYLSREVPRWFAENRCYSCHNNGDAARALYAAAMAKYDVPKAALEDTTRWLADPGRWEANRGNPAASDKKLARIQFAAALADAVAAGFVGKGEALDRAAEMLLKDREADGSWRIDDGELPGSPATWGNVLATYMARRTLAAAPARFAKAVEAADAWLRRRTPGNVLDAATLLLALPGRIHLLDSITAAQASDGGWGPQRHAPAEAFDTAVVLLALEGLSEPGVAAMIAKGRGFLIRSQQESGGWPETTRPSGSQSYAQHISTSGWATLALLKTADAKRN